MPIIKLNYLNSNKQRYNSVACPYFEEDVVIALTCIGCDDFKGRGSEQGKHYVKCNFNGITKQMKSKSRDPFCV